MKQESKDKLKLFMKRRGYLAVLGVCCVALAVTTAFVMGTRGDTQEAGRTVTVSVSVLPSSVPSALPSVQPSVQPSASPASKVIVFASPVKDATVGMCYSEDELCFSKTLGYWCGHMGMDFLGEEGQDCLAVYDGKVESISRDLCDGTVISVRIDDDLTVCYGSLAEETAVAVGDSVKKGDKLGTISDSAYDEFKEGAHVHLTVFEKGLKVDPQKYLQSEEK